MPLNGDGFGEDNEDDDNEDDGNEQENVNENQVDSDDDEPKEIRHDNITTKQGDNEESECGDRFESSHILASFNPTKLKPLEPLDISTRFASFTIDSNKSPRSQLADLHNKLDVEQARTRRLEFELDELKKKIEVICNVELHLKNHSIYFSLYLLKKEYKPKIDTLTVENQKLNKLYLDSKTELKEYQNKSGLHKSHIDELEKLRIENYQLGEYKAKLAEKVLRNHKI